MPFMAVGRYPRRPAQQAQHYAKAVIMRLVAVQMSMNANMMRVLTSIFAVPLVSFQRSFFSEPLLACLQIIMDMIDRDELPDDDPKHPHLREHELEHVRTDI